MTHILEYCNELSLQFSKICLVTIDVGLSIDIHQQIDWLSKEVLIMYQDDSLDELS